jgi:hypothetical protein
VGNFGKTRTAAFCAADPANPKNVDPCVKVMSSRGTAPEALTCESL